MEGMVDRGANMIFATSYGHLEFAENVAERNPDVVVVHQGGLEEAPGLDNLGTYFGTVYEPVYMAGIAAGAASRDRQARLRLRLPDPPDAGQHQRLHARRPVGEPRRRDGHVATGSWCDPASQAQAATSLLDQGVDVITQHQDCTKTIVETTEDGRRPHGRLPRRCAQ